MHPLIQRMVSALPLHALSATPGTQHDVWQLRYGARQAVIKFRKAEFGRRLEKEALWLGPGTAIRDSMRPSFWRIQDDAYHAVLVMSYDTAQKGSVRNPMQFIQSFAPCIENAHKGWALRMMTAPAGSYRQGSGWHQQIVRRLTLRRLYL